MARTYKDSPRRFTCANLREGSKWFFNGEWWWCNNRNSKKRHNRNLRRKRKQELHTTTMDEVARDQHEEMLDELTMWDWYNGDFDYYDDGWGFNPIFADYPEPEPEDKYDPYDESCSFWDDYDYDYLGDAY